MQAVFHAFMKLVREECRWLLDLLLKEGQYGIKLCQNNYSVTDKHDFLQSVDVKDIRMSVYLLSFRFSYHFEPILEVMLYK